MIYKLELKNYDLIFQMSRILGLILNFKKAVLPRIPIH
ncbi:hypothetical protein LEP1GSC193_0426 [Leptospira alstonii serovar Pingchang str. 80-412]|uniref:Uncharacterized protein n=2 Tax=Leptospira alstonii TaxID=28452 RepID=M6CY90_9LEPT|nr:hypothetical protein LEP1GSC194_1598 [Leptospira alstonii serovar Sichuan str. 79601]EQA79139.1 hypothetical protein LEP1GSC193_0426 [Leptospira alstonii serovar Pingchang str. 80-412]